MRLLDLDAVNLRNYATLRHQFSGAPVVLLGNNAQGKSNLLEAIALAATARSPRSTTDRDLVRWGAIDDDVPAMRIVATFSGPDRPRQVELALAADLGWIQARQAGGTTPLRLRKRLRIDGIPRRASELIGLAAVVHFDPDEVGLLAGEPGRRRAFLDAAICQLERDYLRASQDLARVLPQRNALLRAIAEGRATPDQLEFWDERFIAGAATVTTSRLAYLAAILPVVQELHEVFVPNGGRIGLIYRSTIEKYLGEPADPAGIAQQLRRALDRMRPREVFQGVTLVGPQRDDLALSLDGIDLHDFGSRGQQRTAAICLKLAEARRYAERFGTSPLLLLDELFAELDAGRRGTMQALVAEFEQPFVTTTDLDLLSPALLDRAEILQIDGGVLRPLR